jgi:hypothetical protein
MEQSSLILKKEQAVQLAVTGMTDIEIARRIRVSRQLVNTWRNHDSDFISSLAQRRQALRERHQDRLNELIDQSLGIVARALADSADPKTQLQAAMYVLRISGLQGYLKEGKQPSREQVERELIETTLIQVVKEQGFG